MRSSYWGLFVVFLTVVVLQSRRPFITPASLLSHEHTGKQQKKKGGRYNPRKWAWCGDVSCPLCANAAMITWWNGSNRGAASVLRFSATKHEAAAKKAKKRNQGFEWCSYLRNLIKQFYYVSDSRTFGVDAHTPASATLTFYWWESQTALGHLWVTFIKAFSLQPWKGLFCRCLPCCCLFHLCCNVLPASNQGHRNKSYCENNCFNVTRHYFFKGTHVVIKLLNLSSY